MAQNNPLPDTLREWAAAHFAPSCPVTATDVSWPRGSSRVWRATAGSYAVYVKLSPSTQDFVREVAGYAHAARALAPGSAPRLIAADPDLGAIMSTALPGRVVRGLPLPPHDEREAHHQAGQLLRRWHEHSPQASERDRAAVREDIAEQAREAQACLEGAAGHMDAEQSLLVQCVVDELLQLVEDLPTVYRHGDHATRNWLWHDAQHRVGLIDFERAEHGSAASEFVWLYGAVWPERPDLRDAHLAGYGRTLTDPEERFLLLLTTRLGVSYLQSGLTKAQPRLVERGQLVLTRMARLARTPRRAR